MKLYYIFISHGYNYSAVYYTIEKWLNEEFNIANDSIWINCSAPNDSELNNSNENTDKMILNEIKNKIAYSTILIVISDTYNEEKKLIDFEIATAKHYSKHIIALKRWRNTIPIPRKIKKNADEIMDMCKPKLINAIKEYCKTFNPVNNQ